MIKKLLILISMIFLINSCITTKYIKPDLPDYDSPKVDFSRFNKDDFTDLKRIILIQNEIIQGWEKFYGDLKTQWSL